VIFNTFYQDINRILKFNNMEIMNLIRIIFFQLFIYIPFILKYNIFVL